MSLRKSLGQLTILLPALICVLLAVNGCNKSTSKTVTNGKLTISLDDYYLNPQTVTVQGPTRLHIEVVNKGSAPHSLRIKRGGRDVGGTGALTPKESRSVRVQLRKGNYQMFSSLATDKTLGLYGSLTVKQ